MTQTETQAVDAPGEAEPEALSLALAAVLAGPEERVRAVDLPDGRRFWLKRVERLSGRLRLQKGDPARAFARERVGLHILAARGLAVPEIVAEGEGYMLLADAGPSLMQLVSRERGAAERLLTAFAAAGRALARLHRAGLVHGRPAVRDMCWDGVQLRFIDLERFAPERHGTFWQAVDILLFSHSADVQWADDPRWIEAALDAYAADAPEGALAAAARLARRLAPLGVLTDFGLRLKPKSRNLRAVSLTLARLARRG